MSDWIENPKYNGIITSRDEHEARYPTCCLSFSCGAYGDECKGCSNKKYHDGFMKWKAEYQATEPDRIWSRNFYRSKAKQEGAFN